METKTNTEGLIRLAEIHLDILRVIDKLERFEDAGHRIPEGLMKHLQGAYAASKEPK